MDDMGCYFNHYSICGKNVRRVVGFDNLIQLEFWDSPRVKCSS